MCAAGSFCLQTPAAKLADALIAVVGMALPFRHLLERWELATTLGGRFSSKKTCIELQLRNEI
jgi:hypothetical protein